MIWESPDAAGNHVKHHSVKVDILSGRGLRSPLARKMNKTIAIPLLIVVMLLGAPAVAMEAAQSPAVKTVWDGAYTEPQAVRGQQGYVEKCASCHGPDLEGTQGSAVEVDGAPLIGPEFFERWREDD